MARTPEQGHTARCLAATMIAAIENARDAFIYSADQNPMADLAFRVWAQGNNALHWADEYLADSTMTCTCPEV